MKPLCAKWFESVRRRFAESDLILSLLKCLALFHDTQLAFIEQDGDKALVSSNHLCAAQMIAALCKNGRTHVLVATHKVDALLLTNTTLARQRGHDAFTL